MASATKPQPAITLYRGFPSSGNYIWSPFVNKLEARLRFAALSYRTDAGSLSGSPRGKIPYVAISKADSDSEEPNAPILLSDSTLIVANLVKDGLCDDLNAQLSPVAKAHDLALRSLLEEKLSFYQSYERWHENYYSLRGKVLGGLPYPVQVVVGLIAYRKNMATLYGQGTGRYTAEEINMFKKEVWDSLNALLVESRKKADRDETFWVLGGEGPTEADATLFGFIASALVCKAAPESEKIVRGLPAVVDYAQRIHDHYFPDYTCWEQ